jgi:electron transfer flavoprotein beta subunit
VTGIKALEITDGHAVVRRQTESGWEVADVPLPAVLTVKEGINLPRYPSLPGRLKAKKKEIERSKPPWRDGGLTKVRLKLPVQVGHTVEILGKNGDAGAEVVELLQRLRLV